MADGALTADATSSPQRRLATVDILRGITILWVTALHFHVDTRGVPDAATASASAFWSHAAAADPVGAARVVVSSLIGLPGFRLDLLLFVTALVSGMGRPTTPLAFYRRRARSILPAYWLGSVGVLLVAAGCAAWRSGVTGTEWLDQLQGGSRLGLAPYRIEWGDLFRSLSVVGRLQDPRAMQVIAPSLWYVVLVAQLLVVLPWLRRLHARLGSTVMLALSVVVTVCGRAWVFATPPLPTFDANATVICFLPFRMVGPALGLAVAQRLDGRAGQGPSWVPHGAPAVAAALAAVVVAMWTGTTMNTPGTLAGVLGPTIPLACALPGLWWLAGASARRAWLGRLLTWAGTHSLSILVVQDALRLMVGTLVSLGVELAPLTFLLLPAYLVSALLLARAWHRWPDRVAETLGWRAAVPGHSGSR